MPTAAQIKRGILTAGASKAAKKAISLTSRIVCLPHPFRTMRIPRKAAALLAALTIPTAQALAEPCAPPAETVLLNAVAVYAEKTAPEAAAQEAPALTAARAAAAANVCPMEIARQATVLHIRRATIASRSTTSTHSTASAISATSTASAHLTRATVRPVTHAQRARRVRRVPPFSLTTSSFPKKSRQKTGTRKAARLRGKTERSCKSFPTKSKNARKKKRAEHTTVNLAMLLRPLPQTRVHARQYTREKWGLLSAVLNACSPTHQTHVRAATVRPTQRAMKTPALSAGLQVPQAV